MTIVSTIIPIFAIILLGCFARQRGFLQPDFLQPANRLVYYLAIPAMIFRAISRGSLKGQFNGSVLVLTLLAMVLIFFAAWGVCRGWNLPRRQRGTFIQSSFHGNLGYIGLAVSFYFLGEEGFVRASIIAGFVIILQNFLAVVALQMHAGTAAVKGSRLVMVWRIMGNPVILAAVAGISYSALSLPLPLVVERSLDILSGLALPMALLIIGASLSFSLMQARIKPVLVSTTFKLLLQPLCGLGLYRLFGLTAGEYIPALILLASPTATLAYVMANEMEGDADLAVAAISASTMVSALTFSLWLSLTG
ncbi:MAG: AEC family transporter [Deltaproteobacteria bacterium]|nr:AEC family transporter [Candidatus Anaeroferrophillus wilburensis]MBN2887785.1 AEC family transporter [Deltaproteobacteria bacterium]